MTAAAAAPNDCGRPPAGAADAVPSTISVFHEILPFVHPADSKRKGVRIVRLADRIGPPTVDSSSDSRPKRWRPLRSGPLLGYARPRADEESQHSRLSWLPARSRRLQAAREGGTRDDGFDGYRMVSAQARVLDRRPTDRPSYVGATPRVGTDRCPSLGRLGLEPRHATMAAGRPNPRADGRNDNAR